MAGWFNFPKAAFLQGKRQPLPPLVDGRPGVLNAIVNDPAIIMADEPTGNLDSKVGREIMSLLLNLNRERGTTLIIVTHDPTIAQQTQRVIRLRDGLLEEGE